VSPPWTGAKERKVTGDDEINDGIAGNETVSKQKSSRHGIIQILLRQISWREILVLQILCQKSGNIFLMDSKLLILFDKIL